MRFFILAGEASGDLHGSRLAKGLKIADPQAEIIGWGGDHMAQEGVRIEKHYSELAFMGFLEVVKNLPEILSNFRKVKRRIEELRPDAVILIDYPGFNLRMAKWAAQKGMHVFYFISPQLWAWHTSRARLIGKYVERMYVIFPFEKDFYAEHGIEVDYFGHPLVETVASFHADPHFKDRYDLDAESQLVALLPGSRRQEIKKALPVMLSVISDFPHLQFAVAGAPGLGADYYQAFLKERPHVRLILNDTYNLLHHAHAALVTSGTATLEAALFGVPQVICYKANALSYRLAKMLVNKNLQHIGIVNLIAGKTIVPELIQHQFTHERLRAELGKLLDPSTCLEMKAAYENLRRQLFGKKPAEQVATDIVRRLRSDLK